jgi:polygalacturonase
MESQAARSDFSVRHFGAMGNGEALDTAAIQATIDACAREGGGTVDVSAGRYVTGSLFLRSNTALHVEAGAALLGSENPADYPLVETRWGGVEQKAHAPLICGRGLMNVGIVGRGVIDGRGAAWWQRFREEKLEYPRPRLIGFSDSANVFVEGITAANSPAWTIHLLRCENAVVDKVTVVSPADSPNTDGINPDSCRHVRISNCHVSVGDDCIAIKSGTEAEGRLHLSPCVNVAITNCTMAHGHGGVVIGSEMSGGVRNVVVSNCVFVGTDRGIRLKSRRGRGGSVEDIRVTGVVMQDVLCPLTMNLYYHIGVKGDKYIADKRPQQVTEGTPRFRRIHFSHITARNAQYAAGYLYGLPEMPIEDISFDDVSISMSTDPRGGEPEMADEIKAMQGEGLFVCNARKVRLSNLEVTGQRGPALILENVETADTDTRPKQSARRDL